MKHKSISIALIFYSLSSETAMIHCNFSSSEKQELISESLYDVKDITCSERGNLVWHISNHKYLKPKITKIKRENHSLAKIQVSKRKKKRLPSSIHETVHRQRTSGQNKNEKPLSSLTVSEGAFSLKLGGGIKSISFEQKGSPGATEFDVAFIDNINAELNYSYNANEYFLRLNTYKFKFKDSSRTLTERITDINLGASLNSWLIGVERKNIPLLMKIGSTSYSFSKASYMPYIGHLRGWDFSEKTLFKIGGTLAYSAFGKSSNGDLSLDHKGGFQAQADFKMLRQIGNNKSLNFFWDNRYSYFKEENNVIFRGRTGQTKTSISEISFMAGIQWNF
jgi:hypothetical protein